MVNLKWIVLRWAKRLIRPLIPDSLMARYRLAQLSRHSRTNVDVFVSDRRTARRWLAITPDTYRARLRLPQEQPPSGVGIVTDEEFPVAEELREQALRILADPDIGAVVVGELVDSQLEERRRAEPEIAPSLIAVRDEVLREVGGAPPGTHPLPGLVARVRDAGHKVGLIPIEPRGAPAARSDPIDAPSVVIMATVPLHDVGGGARSSQLAFEMLRRGFHVTVLHFAEPYETVDLGLRYVHPRLEQYRSDRFDARSLAPRAPRKALAIVEAPFGSLVTPARHLRRAGWPLAYDIIDDWTDPALGADWYNPELEKELMLGSEMILASAPDLAERARQFGREAELMPNAVNAELFGGDLPDRPQDLPEADLIVGYHGSLYGNWFDWDALRRVAEVFDQAAVVVIGDDRVSHPQMPANVHFLGLKPQRELPAYVQRFSVGVVPFRVTDTTHAVSPLKAYEYLASGVPVAAPRLRSIDGLEGAHLDDDLVKAVKRALQGPPPDRAAALKAHSWSARVSELGLDAPNREVVPELIVTSRPARHYPQNERLLL